MVVGFAGALQAFETIAQTCKGYQAICERLGFSPTVAEQMALQYHAYLCHTLMTAATKAAQR
jgi:hypothetical protein